MSTFVDGWGNQLSRATTTVLTNTPEAKVTWRNAAGAKFSAIVRQKPNPIGFHAKLPGDAK
jgi:hypothetical protein